jgi:hypothetical protein
MFEHACFISFPRHAGKGTEFADHFYDEYLAQLQVYQQDISVFKFDRRRERQKGDDWEAWIQRELCHSAMMISICPPAYFNGSDGCLKEFLGMERLLADRERYLGKQPGQHKWIVGLRLKPNRPMPKLNPYETKDFYDCCASPEAVRTHPEYKSDVELLADWTWQHWEAVTGSPRIGDLKSAKLCSSFAFEPAEASAPDKFPHAGGVGS